MNLSVDPRVHLLSSQFRNNNFQNLTIIYFANICRLQVFNHLLFSCITVIFCRFSQNFSQISQIQENISWGQTESFCPRLEKIITKINHSELNVRSTFQREILVSISFLRKFQANIPFFGVKSMNFLPREKWENGEVPEIIVTPEDYGSELDLGSPKLKRKSAIRISGKR